VPLFEAIENNLGRKPEQMPGRNAYLDGLLAVFIVISSVINRRLSA
jgi:hypothetical protein